MKYNYERYVLTAFDGYIGDEASVAESLNVDLNYPDFLIDGLDEMQGQG